MWLLRGRGEERHVWQKRGHSHKQCRSSGKEDHGVAGQVCVPARQVWGKVAAGKAMRWGGGVEVAWILVVCLPSFNFRRAIAVPPPARLPYASCPAGTGGRGGLVE